MEVMRRKEASESNISEALSSLKSMRITILIEYIKSYLIGLTVYLLLTCLQAKLLGGFPRYGIYFGMVSTAVLTFLFNKNARIALKMVNMNITILEKYLTAVRSNSIILLQIVKLMSHNFAELCAISEFPGVIIDINFDNDSMEDEKGDE